MKSRYALMLSIVLGILATAGLKKVLDRQKKDVEEGEEKVSVASAARNLPEGTIVRAEDVREDHIPRRYHRDALISWRDAEEILVGKKLRFFVKEGQYLRPADIEPPPSLSQAPTIDTGRRLIALQVDLYSGVGGRLRPGSRVDVIAIIRDEGEGQAQEKKGKRGERVLTVLEDVRIFTVGPLDVAKTGYTREGAMYTAVTLDVSPDEAELLAFASSQGRFLLVERSDLDDETGRTPAGGVTRDEFLSRVRKVRSGKE